MTPRISSADLINRACAILGLSRDELCNSKCRRRPVVRMRWAVMYLLHERNPKLSLRQIGRPLGVNDHSSVVHALARSRALVQAGDAEFEWGLNVLRGERAQRFTAWIERAPLVEPACARLLDCVSLNELGPILGASDVGDTGTGPRISMDEIFRRRDEAVAKRADYEAQCLASERARYGVSRQTAARPLSEQVA